jgi:acyl-CoA synthetase (NDP forming)
MDVGIRQAIDRFYHPRTVALIGVSGSFGFGHGLPRFLIELGWEDRIYPVNPNQETIEGIRAYPSVRDVPVDIDLACIMVPSHAVEKVLEDCAVRGVKAVIVMSAGFAETGVEGKKRQDALTRIAGQAGIRMIGPNCIGIVDVPNGFATVEILLRNLEPGNISIVAQSGVFGNVLLDGTPSQGVGIAKAATIGNRADLDETDFLAYYADDPDTEVIVLYLESIRRGREFLKTARQVALKKPVLAYLGGQTDAGRRATGSHTGSMAGFRRMDKDVLRQAGIWIAEDPVELLEAAKVFSSCPLPQGNKVFTVTASGSLGVMAADRIVKEGLAFAELSPTRLSRLRQLAPAWMNLGNPLDVGPSGLFREAMNAALESPEVDAVMAFPVIPWAVVSPLLSQDRAAVEALFVDRAVLNRASSRKPVVVCVPGHPEWREACRRLLFQGVPFVSTPQAAARTLGALHRYARWRRNTERHTNPRSGIVEQGQAPGH